MVRYDKILYRYFGNWLTREESMGEDDTTIAKTLWSETLIDMLIASLKANKADVQIKGLLKECKQKGFKASYLTEKVRKELDQAAASRIKRLM